MAHKPKKAKRDKRDKRGRAKGKAAKQAKPEIVDATEPVELLVTHKDVVHSRKLDPAHCAAAVALMRTMHTADVRVYMSVTYVRVKDTWVRYATPASIAREITSFDRATMFEPGAYHLQPPAPSRRLGVHRSGPSGKRTGTPRIRPYHITAKVRPRGVAPR